MNISNKKNELASQDYCSEPFLYEDDINDVNEVFFHENELFFDEKCYSVSNCYFLPIKALSNYIQNVECLGSTTLISHTIDYNENVIELECLTIQEFSDIVLTVHFSDFSSVLRIFIYCDSLNRCFFSSRSFYDAFNNSKYSESLEKLNQSNNVDSFTVKGPFIIINNLTATGSLYWKDENNNQYPLIGVYVDLTIPNSTYHQGVYTNSNGQYSFTINNVLVLTILGSPTLSFSVQSKTIDSLVINRNSSLYSFNFVENYTGNPIISSTHTFNPNNSTDRTNGEVFYITQESHYYSSYFSNLSNEPLSNLNIFYDRSGNANWSSFGFDSTINSLFIPYYYSANTNYPHPFCSWDQFGHEYGHKIEYEYSLSSITNLNHVISSNLIDLYINDSSYGSSNPIYDGLTVSWNEGLATYLSLSAQKSFPSLLQTNITYLGDYKYTSSLAFECCFDLDRFDCSYNYFNGDASESTVTAILFNLFDSVPTTNDFFSLSDTNIWSCLIDCNAINLSQFISYMYNDYSLNTNNFAELLSNCGLVDSYASLSSTNLLTWSSNSGSVNRPFNSFVVMFYNHQYQSIFQTQSLTSNSYQLTRDDVEDIRDATLNYFFAKISYTCSDNYSTGPYYSIYFEFPI